MMKVKKKYEKFQKKPYTYQSSHSLGFTIELDRVKKIGNGNLI